MIDFTDRVAVVAGGFHLSQPAYREMKKSGGGRFVFVSSSAGVFGQPMEAHYAAAKAGLVGLTNVIAIEGEAHGIISSRCRAPKRSTYPRRSSIRCWKCVSDAG